MRAILLALIGISLWAGTTVSDTIKDASGRPVMRGYVTFTPTTTFESGSNANWVAQSPVSAAIIAGVFTVALEPTPTGDCYTVTFSPGSISSPQLAAVPTSSGTFTLSQIINTGGCVSTNAVLAAVAGATQIRNQVPALSGGNTPVLSGVLDISSGVATYVSGATLTDSMLGMVAMISGVGYVVTTVTDVSGVANSLQFTPTPTDGSTVSYTVGNTWTLTHLPNGIGTTCWYNGLHQSPGGIDYTLTGAVITSVYWNPTNGTANPTCDYQY